MRTTRLIVLLLASTASASVLAASCDGFTDVDSTASYCPAVTYLKNTGITLGCTASTYCPTDPVTRAQMALYLYRMGNNVVFQQGGNAFGTTAVLGTKDSNALEIDINGNRVMRYEQPSPTSPNIIGGNPSNGTVSEGALYGVVIAGGGASGNSCFDPGTSTFTAACANQASAVFSTVGGGYGNKAGYDGSLGFDTIAGGNSNSAYGQFTAIAGGEYNVAGGSYSVVGGGSGNMADGVSAVIAGGAENAAEGKSSTVGGGNSNVANGGASTIAGGNLNQASGSFSTVAGGQNNIASGASSAVLGGNDNSAGGDYSVVMGYRGFTTTAGTGSFVFADSTGYAFGATAANEFLVAASGGIKMLTNKDSSTGCSIPAGGGAWACSSSRSVKRDFSTVDSADILAKVAALPVMRWRYMNEPDTVRHIGTFAQDFRAAFGLGENDTTISTVDADGIAMAAIQGLNAKVDARDQVIADLQAQLAQLRSQMEHLANAR